MNDAELRNHLSRISVPPAAQAEILAMIRNSPARVVGVSAKDNVVVHFHSRKNGDLSMELVANQAVSPGWMVSGSDQFRRTVAGGL